MSNIVNVTFKKLPSVTSPYLWQYDYGNLLRIHGLSLNNAVQVHFSVDPKSTDIVRRVGITHDDGCTEVDVPDVFLTNGHATEDYYIYAYIYDGDFDDGKTVYTIKIPVRSRAFIQGIDYCCNEDDPGNTFGNIVSEVSELVGDAIDASQLAEAFAHGHEKYPEYDEDNAKYWAEQAKASGEESINAADEAKEAALSANESATSAAASAESASENAEHIESIIPDAIQAAAEAQEAARSVEGVIEAISGSVETVNAISDRVQAQVDIATEAATSAQDNARQTALDANRAENAKEESERNADRAREASVAAENSSVNAAASATSAANSAVQAALTAANITEYVIEAKDAAQSASNYNDQAHDASAEAWSSANEARERADAATESASKAKASEDAAAASAAQAKASEEASAQTVEQVREIAEQSVTTIQDAANTAIEQTANLTDIASQKAAEAAESAESASESADKAEEHEQGAKEYFDTLSNMIVDDYEVLHNLPQINNQTLLGNVSLQQLGTRAILYNSTEGWNNQRDLVSEEGVVYIYSDAQSYTSDDGSRTVYVPGIKIGDGNAYLIDLPFTGSDALIAEHVNDTGLHVTSEEKLFWNNKVDCYLGLDDNENVIFTRDKIVIGD